MAEGTFCGTGSWASAPKPGDPDNNVLLTATPAFGGIDVEWTYPGTNPHAVSFVRLYRSTNPADTDPMLHAIVSGNFFYDKTTTATLIEYSYWIEIVSFNGTVGDRIGPATATAKPPITEVLEGLTAKIDAGHLAQSLQSEIDRISGLESNLAQETTNRLTDIDSLGSAFSDLELYSSATRDLVNQEAADRQLADDAFVSTVNQMYVDFDGSLASQKTEITAAYQNHVATALTAYETAVNAAAARASLADGLRVEWNDEIALALTEYYTAVETDSALASQKTLLQAEIDDDIALALQSYETAVDAQAARASLKTTIGAERDDAIALALQDYETAVTAQAARASLQTGLQASIDDNTARIATAEQTIVDGDTALASRMDVLEVTSGGHLWISSFETLGDDFDRWGADATATITASTDAYSGSQAALVTSTNAAPSSTGVTNGARVEIDEKTAMAYSGRRVRVSCYAKQPATGAAAEFAVAYSTNDAGNSGWQKFVPTTAWQKFSFLYDVPEASVAGTDWLGIWGDTSGTGLGVLVDYLTIEKVATEDDLPEITAAIGTEQQARIDQDNALASQITTTETTLGNDIAQVQTNLDSEIQTVNGELTSIGALYTAKVNVNGLIGGFGVYNDGSEVDAGFDVDRFWVGRTGTDKIKPFIIDNGVTYINEAVIKTLTFDKLRAADGSLIVSNGKLRAEAIDANNLHVAGATRFSGDVQSENYVAGSQGWLIRQNGFVELNDAVLRGNVELQSITVNGESPTGGVSVNVTSYSGASNVNRSSSTSVAEMPQGSKLYLTVKISDMYAEVGCGGSASWTEAVDSDGDVMRTETQSREGYGTASVRMRVLVDGSEIYDQTWSDSFSGQGTAKVDVYSDIDLEYTYPSYRASSSIAVYVYLVTDLTITNSANPTPGTYGSVTSDSRWTKDYGVIASNTLSGNVSRIG